jgi:hypothetical protein
VARKDPLVDWHPSLQRDPSGDLDLLGQATLLPDVAVLCDERGLQYEGGVVNDSYTRMSEGRKSTVLSMPRGLCWSYMDAACGASNAVAHGVELVVD